MDLLRALAISCVFLGHLLHNAFPVRPFQYHGILGYHDSFLQTYLMLFFGSGHLGVVMFFMISGFCIRLSTVRNPVLDCGKFMWKRLWRIAPPYWLCLGLLVFVGYNNPTHGNRALDFALHTVFLHNITANSFQSINGPFWSIALEVQTYAMFPLLLLMISRLGKFRAGVILAGLTFFSALVGRPSVQGILHEHIFFAFLGRSPLTLWFAWYLGLVLADDYLKGKVNMWNSWMLVALLFAFLPLVTMVYVLSPFGEPFNALLVYLIAERLLHSPLPKHSLVRWISFIGTVSYSIYLWFDPILSVASQWCLNRGIVGFWLTAVGCLVVFPAVIALSYLLFGTVESPSIRIGRLLYSKVFRKQPTVG